MLESINFDQQTEFKRTELYISIAEAWFAADDHVNAEGFLNKAAHLIHKFDNIELQSRYRAF